MTFVEVDASGNQRENQISANVAADGTYEVDVPAGKYVIDPLAPGPGRYPVAGPVDVTVPAAARASAIVSFDTGIR